MRAVISALFAGLVGVTGAVAQPLPKPPACRLIADPSDRLRCYDEDANFDFAAVVLKELECDRPPRAGQALKVMMRRNAVRSLAFDVVGGLNYFDLARPEKVDGLTVVAVFGFDETGHFPFVRVRGEVPAATFGIVTRDPTSLVDEWRLRHSPALSFEDTGSRLKDGKDIACATTMSPSAAASGGAPAAASPATPAPAGPARVADDPFEAGLAPKRK